MSTASRLRRARAAARAGSADRGAARPRPTGAGSGRRAQLRYAFDNSMSHGPGALIAYLGVAVLAVVVVFAAIVLVIGVGTTHNPITAIYNVMLHMIDTGTLAGNTGAGAGYIAINLVVTFAGIFIFSAFIGILATGIDLRLQELRKGRSHVLERDHTLILGWSESIFMILSELAIANEGRQRPRVVILAERDKVEMEDALRERVPDLRGTRVVCRSGSPIAIADLSRVNHRQARSVIVLAADGDDHHVIKTILALTRGAGTRETPYHIVAEIEEPGNLEVARLAGGKETVILDKGRTISRLIVQTSRQSGAAAVYQDLLDFDGDEIHSCYDASLGGRTYGETLLAYENCSVIGVREVDGDVKLNPPMDRRMAPGELILAVARDVGVLESAQPFRGDVDASAISTGPRQPRRAEATLVLGYNQRTPAVIAELDAYSLPGARLKLVAAPAVGKDAVIDAVGSLAHLSLAVENGDTTDRKLLDSQHVARFDRIIVMADASVPDRGRADARALVTLLHLRDIAKRRSAQFTIVSEILDEADRELASIAQVDDIVVSDRLISYLLAQISENRDLAEVFTELLEAKGSEVYIRPVGDYVVPGGRVSCATLVASARRRGETAFGYRVAADAARPEAGYGVVLNPLKSRMFETAEGDRLIVLALE